MDCIRQLIEMWIIQPFSPAEMRLADSAAFSSLKIIHFEANGQPIGIPPLNNQVAGSFNRIVEYLRLTPAEVTAMLRDLTTQLEKELLKQVKKNPRKSRRQRAALDMCWGRPHSRF